MTATPTLKQRLQRGEAALGCWLQLMSPLAAEVVGKVGFDCVVIDLEHGPGSIPEAVQLMQALQGSACAPLIRVPDGDKAWLKRALDAGAQGCMVPAVEGPEAARAAVAGSFFPPLGARGLATGAIRASGFGLRESDYLAQAVDGTLLICQIETPGGVAAVEEIAALDGVDMLFVGPNDLAASLGHLGQLDHPDVVAATARVEAAARGAGKLLGAIPTPGRSVADLKAAGYHLIMADVDSLLLREGGLASVAAFRSAASPN